MFDPAIAVHPGVGPSTADAPGTEFLSFQRCRWCHTAMYHRLLCPVCAGSDFRMERSEGIGTVRHSTFVHRNTPATRNVSLIEMTEGFTVQGRVLGPHAAIYSGVRVQLATVEDPVRGQPVFKLSEGPYGSWL